MNNKKDKTNLSKEQKKIKKNEKALQKKLKEIETISKVIDKKTGRWVYCDKDGNKSQIVFSKKDKSFEIEQKGKNYRAMIQDRAFSFADVGELTYFTLFFNNPEEFLKRFTIQDYIERPQLVVKCYTICMLSIYSKKKENDFLKQPNADLMAQEALITSKHKPLLKKALHIRKHKIHYLVHQLNEEEFCYCDSEDHKSKAFGKDHHPLCLECDENGNYSACLGHASKCKVPIDNLDDLSSITDAIKAPNRIKEFLGLPEFEERKTFLTSLIDIVEESIDEKLAKNAKSSELSLYKKDIEDYRTELLARSNQNTLSL